MQSDNVKSPSHYCWIPGIECIQVVRHFDFCRGSAIKYLWRSGRKGSEIEDLRKAIEMINKRIAYLESGGAYAEADER